MCGDCEIIDPVRVEKIARIEAMAAEFKPAFMDVIHTFGEGIYTRSGKIKSGEIIIGAKHRAANVFTITKGKIIVWDEFHGTRMLVAPFSEMTKPGTQRLGYAVEDVEGCNILQTDKTTVLDVENEMLFPFAVPLCIGEKILNLIEAKL